MGGGSPDRVARALPTSGQGSKVYVLCAEPKEHKHFRPGTPAGKIGYPAGRIGDRGDREIVYVCGPSTPPEEFLGPSGPRTPLRGLKGRKFMCQMFMCLFPAPNLRGG